MPVISEDQSRSRQHRFRRLWWLMVLVPFALPVLALAVLLATARLGPVVMRFGKLDLVCVHQKATRERFHVSAGPAMSDRGSGYKMTILSPSSRWQLGIGPLD